MTTDPPPSVFRFRDFELDLAAYQLRHNGKPVHLERRPMELLVLLVSRHGQLVTRDEIVERLWPGKVVIEFDAGLNTLVSKARHALHDPADAPACIETVPGKGYRFIAPIEPLITVSPVLRPSRPARKWSLAAVPMLLAALFAVYWFSRNHEVPSPAVAVQAPAELKSIAVLPFADLSAEQDQQYFCDGLSEEIINLLTQSRRMRVIPRTSSFSFRHPRVDVATVAKRLDVTHVLEGSVRRSGKQLRITAQLIDATTSSHVWSQTYDRETQDIFKIQDDIAMSVARELQQVFPARKASSPPYSVESYEHFLRAQYLYHRRAPGDLERAARLYRQAIDANDSFARAWAGLASTYWLMTRYEIIEAKSGKEDMRQAAERALSLDPGLAEAHLRLANYYWNRGDFTTGDTHRRKAGEIDPDNPLLLSFSASEALRDHHLVEAIEISRRLVAMDPLAAGHRHSLASFYYFSGRLEEARREMFVALELNPAIEADVLAFVLILEHKFQAALDLVQKWPDNALREQCLALIYLGRGQHEAADAALARLVDVAGDGEPGRIAEVYANRRQIGPAFEWLERAVHLTAGNDRVAKKPVWIYQFSPFLGPLRDDPRWQPWVAAANAASPR